MKPKLTQKEEVIALLICEGFTSKDIGGKLGNKSTTIDAHKNNLLRKYQANNMPHLIAILFRNKLIK